MIYTVTLNPARDRSLIIPDFGAGKVNRVLESRDDPGGKGINISKTLLSLDINSVAMGIVGGDAGEYISNSLTAMGIDCDFVLSERPTRTNIKISDPVNHVTTDINEKGETDIRAAEKVLEKLLNRIKPSDIVAIAGKLDVNKVDIQSWITLIRKAGANVFLDTEGEALKQGVQAKPFLIKPNEDEFACLTGMEKRDFDTLTGAAIELKQSSGINALVISLGEKGALGLFENEVYHSLTPKLKALSTVGAGDSMMAGLCCAFDLGMQFDEALMLATACASAAVMCPGTQSPNTDMINEMREKVTIRRMQ